MSAVATSRAAELLIPAPTGMALSMAALATTLVVLIAGSLLIMRGLQDLKRLDVMPRQTLTTIKEDVQWAKHPTKSGTR